MYFTLNLKSFQGLIVVPWVEATILSTVAPGELLLQPSFLSTGAGLFEDEEVKLASWREGGEEGGRRQSKDCLLLRTAELPKNNYKKLKNSRK